MATWNDLCYVRQTVCEKISEDFYELCGEEITNYFQNKESEEIDINTIFIYCFDIVLRNNLKTAFNYKETFRKFMDSFNIYSCPKMKWIKDTSSHIFPVRYICSNCNNDELYKTPFCPICGAMEVKDD